MKTIAKEVKGYILVTILTPLFMLLEVAMELELPNLMAVIIDDGVNAGNMTVILRTGAFMILAALVGLFAGIAGGRFGAVAAAGLAKNLRAKMFRNI